ncbi:DUF1194 domain-containing protein [Rhodobacteraceae bacterium RKSG542]|uniref:DUF1194 domain-containing protein n=1 Tax=Pseudovibrio flavus TaxID=2529854 RepID=UPI0012BCF295|nr:DUF1194 domain-containing protein [Pseudovibrio flavus]MTI17217.1 DUF1194 domain-containing protein [Pseudovibrio flavus]
MRSKCTKPTASLFLSATAGAFLAASSSYASDKWANLPMQNEVDLELVLAVDISQSMDPDEQKVQREGYIAALTSDEVMAAVKYGPIGRIAVTYLEWGGKGEQFVVADWAVIDGLDSAVVFANQIAEAPLRRVQRTSISSALAASTAMVLQNNFEGLRKVIDISGDGPNNQGTDVTQARDLAISNGITINGLPLMLKMESISWQSMLHLDKYYEDCVIGGPGAFSIPVRSQEAFGDAIRMKLVLEIAGLTQEKPKVVQVAEERPKIACSLFN